MCAGNLKACLELLIFFIFGVKKSMAPIIIAPKREIVEVLFLVYKHAFFGAFLIVGTSVQRTNWLSRLYQLLWTGHKQDPPTSGFTYVHFVARKVAKSAKMSRFFILFQE